MSDADAVRVGAAVVRVRDAADWSRRYFTGDRLGPDPAAFPAYDCFETRAATRAALSDGELLAPVLLNVRVSIRSYYGLQRVRPRLEEVLGTLQPSACLTALSDDELGRS